MEIRRNGEMIMNKQEEKRYNPPGQDQLDYRAGDYAGFLRQMEALVRLPGLTVGGKNIANPLENLDLDSDYNMAAALFKTWAVVGDILTFYQERIANEGYLRTAIERKSILELTGAIGYTLKPGLAAGTYLAFTLLETADTPPTVIIPAGTGVQGMPGQDQDQPPLTFETDCVIEARTQWNAMNPYIPVKTITREFNPKQPELLMDGTTTGLEPGDHLLVVGTAENTEENSTHTYRYFCTVKKVEPIRESEYTKIILESDIPGNDPKPVLKEYQVFSFQQQCALFGYNAPDWDSLTHQEKITYGGTPIGGLFYYTRKNGNNTWTFAGEDLTDKNINVLDIDETGNIYAGTENGLFRSPDKGAAWEDINTGLVMLDIHALYLDSKGYLYAGTSAGGVYRSTDQGDSWEYIQGSLTTEPNEDPDGDQWKVVDNRLPNTVIRCIIGYTDETDSQSYLFAGTDTGVFRYGLEGNKWEAINLAGVKVNTLAFAKIKNNENNAEKKYKTCLLAGTDRGVFKSSDFNNNDASIIEWKDADTELDCRIVYDLLTFPRPSENEENDKYLFAGTDKGVFMYDFDSNSWQQPGTGEFSRVRSLAICTVKTKNSPILLAGTDKGVFYSKDLGKKWWDFNTGLTNRDINTLAINTAGLLAVGAPFMGVEETQWPGFHILDSRVDLVDAVPGIVTGSWLVLKQDEKSPPVFSTGVTSVSGVIRTGYAMTGQVTRLGVVEGSDDLEDFDLRETRVFAQDENIPIYKEQVSDSTPIQGNTINLAGSVQGLKPGQLIAVTGQ
jgi:hypothetical protein